MLSWAASIPGASADAGASVPEVEGSMSEQQRAEGFGCLRAGFDGHEEPDED
jgi:hypothetical protein